MVAAAQVVPLLGQDKDASALSASSSARDAELGRHLREAPALRRPGPASFRGHAVSKRYRPGLVEKEHVDVARRLDGAAAAHGEHVF